MKTTITSLLGIIAMIFIGCSNEPKKEVSTNTLQYFSRSAQPVEEVTKMLDVKVSAVAILPDGKEVEVKKFDTPPTQEINGIAHLKVSDTSDIALDLPIKGIAHVTIVTNTGLKVLRLPYHMQRKGDMISPTCGNSISLAQK